MHKLIGIVKDLARGYISEDAEKPKKPKVTPKEAKENVNEVVQVAKPTAAWTVRGRQTLFIAVSEACEAGIK